MHRTTAKVLGFLVLGLGLLGIVAGERQLLGFLNVDATLDVARLGLAALLLYAAYQGSYQMVHWSLIGFAVAYIGLGILGMIDPTVAGLFPSELSLFDIVFHLATGVGVLAIALKHDVAHISHA